MFVSEAYDVDAIAHPLDTLETVLNDYNWVFDRTDNDELYVKLSGKINEYHVYFAWDEKLKIMQLNAHYDMNILQDKINTANATLSNLNDNIYLGHFTIKKATNQPVFRYSLLLNHMSEPQAQSQLNEILDISLAQCERCASAFSLLSSAGHDKPEHMDLALMDAQGQS